MARGGRGSNVQKSRKPSLKDSKSNYTCSSVTPAMVILEVLSHVSCRSIVAGSPPAPLVALVSLLQQRFDEHVC